MHGHGPAPQQSQRPTEGMLVLLRVTFVVLSVASCGMLTWGAMLRVAIVTRTQRDWTFFFVSLGLLVGSFALLIADGTDELTTWRGNTGAAALIIMGIAGASYFLYADIRHFQSVPRTPPRPPAPYGAGPVPGGPVAPAPGYGYPHPAAHAAAPPQGPQPYGGHTPPGSPCTADRTPPPGPYTPTVYSPAPGPGTPAARPSAPPTPPAPSTPPAGPPPQPRPAPARIDQVRAELDELSDFLRSQDTTAPGPESGPTGHRSADQRQNREDGW